MLLPFFVYFDIPIEKNLLVDLKKDLLEIWLSKFIYQVKII